MDAFLTELTQAIQTTVLKSLSAKIQQFADAVSKASDGKLTSEQVMGVWNTMHPETAVSADAKTEAKSPTQRTKTDKTRKCQTLKQSGKDKGSMCGKNCVLGKDTCVSHTPKEAAPAGAAAPVAEKTSAPATPASKPAEKPVLMAAPSSPSAALEVKIGTDEQLKATKVDDLKTLLRSAKINFASKDRKDTLIALLVKARDSASASAAPAPVASTSAPFTSPSASAPAVAASSTSAPHTDHTDCAHSHEEEEVAEEETEELVLED
jgi:hypothetical protein